MAISDFHFLPSKIKISIFSEMNTNKIKIFDDIKNGIYSTELYSNNQCAKFQAYIFISGCAMAQKPGKHDDVTY